MSRFLYELAGHLSIAIVQILKKTFDFVWCIDCVLLILTYWSNIQHPHAFWTLAIMFYNSL